MSFLLPFIAKTPTLLDQHFGVGMHEEDLMDSMANLLDHSVYPRRHYLRLWQPIVRSTPKHDTGSKIAITKDNYQVHLDVQQFAPEEITVKVIDRQIVIEGKHEEKQDEHGFISRNFIRKYALPKGYKIDEIASTLSSDGILTITAPKEQPSENENERIVQIVHTGKEHKAAKSLETDNKMEQ